MHRPQASALQIPVPEAGSVSALLLRPEATRACFVFAHGAGAGMDHPFMAAFAAGLAARGIATLRYQFPFMERGSRRTDPPARAHAAVRAAVAAAAGLVPGVLRVAGGKSFGGRMTSQAQALAPLAGVAGIVFVGFPLHPADRPSTARAEHLGDVAVPMLFLQGDRDELAEIGLVGDVVAGLGERASLLSFADADHSFHVRARSGTSDEAVRAAMLDGVARWLEAFGAA